MIPADQTAHRILQLVVLLAQFIGLYIVELYFRSRFFSDLIEIVVVFGVQIFSKMHDMATVELLHSHGNNHRTKMSL